MELEKEREAEKMQLASAAASGGVPLSDISNVVMDIMSANPVMVMRTAPAPNMNVSSGALLSMSGASNTNVSSGALLTTDNKIDYLVSGMRHLLSFTLPASNASGSSSGATTTWGMNSGLFTPVKMPPEPEEEEEEEEPENNNNIVPAPAPAPNVTVENDEETEDMGSNSGPTTGGGRRTRNRKNKNKKKKRTRRSKH